MSVTVVRTIAFVGGESSGKTTLARELAKSLSISNSVAVTDEVLRVFVDREGRAPTVDEQQVILKLQIKSTEMFNGRGKYSEGNMVMP